MEYKYDYIRPSKLDNYNGGYVNVHKSMIRMLGITEALLMSEIKYWSEHNQRERKTLTHLHDGQWWMYMSGEDWAEELTVSESTIKRAVKTLKDLGIINVQRFDKHKWEHVNWFSINKVALDLCVANWYAYGCPANNEKGTLYSSFINIQKSNFDMIDKGFLNAQNEIKRLEQIIYSNENKLSSRGQIDLIDDVNLTQSSTTDTNTDTNNFPETKNSNSNSKNETEKYSELFVKPANVVSENEFLDFSLVKWIRQKNGSGKTSMRRYEKSLAESRKYDNSKEISALELYESDNVFRTWCEERYSELHKDSYGDKSLGVENTVKMVIDEPCFFAWQEKKRGVVEAMDEVQYDEDLSEYDKMQDKGLDMFEEDDDE